MQDSSSTKQTSKTTRNIILFLIAIVFLTVALFYSCIQSSPRISVSKEAPITFYTKGSNTILFFEVIGKWKLYPRYNGLTLKELSTVKYGEVPSSCRQVFPENSLSPSPLIEGERYEAFIVIFDDPPIRVSFTIKDGKPVDIVEAYR